MMLIEIQGPDPRIPNREVIYWRTVIEDDIETQRATHDRLHPFLVEGWTVVYRPLGSLDGIVKRLAEIKKYR